MADRPFVRTRVQTSSSLVRCWRSPQSQFSPIAHISMSVAPPYSSAAPRVTPERRSRRAFTFL